MITRDTNLCDILQASPLALTLLLDAGLMHDHIKSCAVLGDAAVAAQVPLEPLLLALNRELYPASYDGAAYRNLSLQAMLQLLEEQHRDFIERRLPHLELISRRLQQDVLTASPNLERITVLILQLKASLTAHILEEQEELFGHVRRMQDFLQRATTVEEVKKGLGLPSPCRHLIRDDEDANIFLELRSLTSDYHAPAGSGIMLKHLYNELERFETDLQRHENAEMEILLGKVLSLEDQVLERLGSL